MGTSQISKYYIYLSRRVMNYSNITEVSFDCLRLGGGLFGDSGQSRQSGAEHRERRFRLLSSALRGSDPGARSLRQRGVKRNHIIC